MQTQPLCVSSTPSPWTVATKLRIVVLGHTGFVGNALYRRLCDAGHQVYFLPRDNNPDKVSDRIRRARQLEQLAVFSPEIIVNCAGEITDKHLMYEANVQLVHDLLTATVLLPYKLLIHVGSSAEYGRQSESIDEDCPLNPTNWYEATKAAASMLLQAHAKEHGKPIVIARPFSLYGPHDTPRKLLPTLLRAARGDKCITLAPEPVHDWLFIEDFIDGLLAVMERREKVVPGEVVNFGTGNQWSNLEVVRWAEQIMDVDFKIIVVRHLRDHDSASWVCDPAHAKTKYGWKASHTLWDGIRATIKAEQR